jgi:integrase
VGGTRLRRTYATEAEAKGAMAIAKAEAKTHGLKALEVSHADRIRWQSWGEKLPSGVSIDAVFKFYFDHHPTLRPETSAAELMAEYRAELHRLGRSPRYIKETIALLKASPVGDPQTRPTRDAVLPWITQTNLAPASQTMRRAVLRAFFEWQVANRYLLANPLAGAVNRIRIARIKQTEIMSFGAVCAEKLLKTASSPEFSPLLGYVVVAMFAGLRPDEIKRTTLALLDLEGGTIRVSAKAAKTGQTRVIELAPAAIKWLTHWREINPSAQTFCPSNFRKRWDSLRDAAGLLSEWVPDILRHTFASMHYAMHQNASQLKAIMGHSQGENTLFQHYRAVQTISGETISKRMAEEFWALTPSMGGKNNL